MVYKIFDRKTSVSAIKNEIKQNEQSAEEVNQSIVKQF